MTEFTVIVTHILALAVGFVSGTAVNWQARKVGGLGVLVPSLNLSPRRVDILLSLGVVVAVILTLLQSAFYAREQQRCLESYWGIIEHRDEISGNHREANRRLADDLVEGLEAGELSPSEILSAHRVYEMEMEALDTYIEENQIRLNRVPEC